MTTNVQLPVQTGAVQRFLRLLAALIAVTLPNFPSAVAQDCAECMGNLAPEAPEMAAEWSIKKQVNEVNVFFVAAEGKQLVGDLSSNDITVRDDNKAPAAILGFHTERDLPLRVGLLIDTSDSLNSRFRFEQAAAAEFLRHTLGQTGDQGFVMGFSDHSHLIQDLTHDPDLLGQAVRRLKIGGGTALYDAVAASCRKLRQADGAIVARVLVILSDGQANAGDLRLEDAIDVAQRSEVTVYTISTHHPTAPMESEDPNAVLGNQNLRKLAEQTGGRVLFPGRAKEIGKAFTKITEELRSRYSVSYRPADFTNDGRYRKIGIEARKAGKKLHVRARKGYYARATSSDMIDSSLENSKMLSALPPKH
jgi:Ca-activated chloride channel family protein